MIILTELERDKFVAYLEQEAASDEGLIEQTRKLNAGGAMDIMIKKMSTESMAMKLIANRLRITEHQSIE